MYKGQIMQQINAIADQIARFTQFKTKLQTDLQRLVKQRKRNIIQVAKTHKGELDSLQQSCLELLMNEKMAQHDKFDMQLKVMEL